MRGKARCDPPGRRPRASGTTARRVLRALLIFAVLLVVEYLLVPKLIGAGRDIGILARLNIGWLLAAVALETGSLWCYAALLHTLLPTTRRLPMTQLFRITLAATAVGHVVPAGGPALGYQLLTGRGVQAADAAVVIGSAAIGSALVLNAMLWVALLVSIPLAGVHTAYVVVALLALITLIGVALLVFAFTRGEERAVRIVRGLGRHLPRVGPDRMESVVRRLAESIEQLARHREMWGRATAWAAGNWLLDAAALWAVLAALRRFLEPFELFAAYGLANVLAVIPAVPGGLGMVEASTASLLVSFGVARSVAAFGVLGWRLINFWLPIPVGATAYLSLRLRRPR